MDTVKRYMLTKGAAYSVTACLRIISGEFMQQE